MAHPDSTLTIGDVAAAAGVGVETVRFYQRRKLIAEPPKPIRGIRRYGPQDVARIAFIKSAQRLGFTLEEIESLLALDEGTQCDQARGLAEQKLREVRQKLQDLRRMERALAGAVRECAGSSGKISCPLISTLRRRE